MLRQVAPPDNRDLRLHARDARDRDGGRRKVERDDARRRNRVAEGLHLRVGDLVAGANGVRVRRGVGRLEVDGLSRGLGLDLPVVFREAVDVVGGLLGQGNVRLSLPMAFNRNACAWPCDCVYHTSTTRKWWGIKRVSTNKFGLINMFSQYIIERERRERERERFK